MPALLNIFVDFYNITVRDLPDFWRNFIAISSLVATLYFFYKAIKKSSDKQPVNWTFVVLMVLFCAITILYTVA